MARAEQPEAESVKADEESGSRDATKGVTAVRLVPGLTTETPIVRL